MTFRIIAAEERINISIFYILFCIPLPNHSILCPRNCIIDGNFEQNNAITKEMLECPSIVGVEDPHDRHTLFLAFVKISFSSSPHSFSRYFSFSFKIHFLLFRRIRLLLYFLRRFGTFEFCSFVIECRL